MRSALAAAVAAVLLGACGGQNLTTVTGSVTGTVIGSPCRPVERVGDPPCPPLPGVKVAFSDASAHTFNITTGAPGTYLISLAPGTYSVRVGRGFRTQPDRVMVAAGQTVTLNLTYDTGIR